MLPCFEQSVASFNFNQINFLYSAEDSPLVLLLFLGPVFKRPTYPKTDCFCTRCESGNHLRLIFVILRMIFDGQYKCTSHYRDSLTLNHRL